MKHLFAQAGLPQAKYAAFLKRTGNRRRTAAYSKLKRSWDIRASSNRANLGSSVGISKCRNREELEKAFELAFEYDRKIVVEEGIA
ncbi:hypothetical protein ACSE3M_13510 [Bacillus velezensis]